VGAYAAQDLGPDELPVFERDPAEHEQRQLELGVHAVDGALVSGAVRWSGVTVGEQPAQVSERVLELEPE
jgi:hypothetical protein